MPTHPGRRTPPQSIQSSASCALICTGPLICQALAIIIFKAYRSPNFQMVHTLPRAISRQKCAEKLLSKSSLFVSKQKKHHQKPQEASLRLNKKGGGGSRLKARLGCNQTEEYQLAGDNSNHLPTLDE